MLKIYNSLSNKIEEFKPIHENKVNMYVCGPTVYDDIHIGNGRPVVFFDVVKRYLQYLDYGVKYASNITDVDDKIIDRAQKLHITEKELATTYTNNFFEIAKKIGGYNFDVTPHATNYIEEMIKFIGELIADGFAYKTQSGVYFRVDKIKDYGILSNQQVKDLKTGVRIDLETDKEKDYDFALWKNTEEGIKYHAPWGDGRPGWHTECVVMTNEIFGGEIDIHGGGFDLKFPHHENEIAQSVAKHDHHLAKYWMHVGRLDLANEKMSKSLGNDIKLKDLVETYNPNAYRLMLLAHHYRAPIQFSDDLIEQYQKAYDKISYTLNKWHFHMILNNIDENGLDHESIKSFEEFMNDDFATPRVITLIDKLIKDLNKDFKAENYNTIILILNTLGLIPNILEVLDEDIENYKNWQQARLEKNYEKADIYRKPLLDKGFI